MIVSYVHVDPTVPLAVEPQDSALLATTRIQKEKLNVKCALLVSTVTQRHWHQDRGLCSQLIALKGTIVHQIPPRQDSIRALLERTAT